MKANRSFGVCVLLFAAGVAQAQNYPTRAIRMIVPFVPGGATDILGRVTAQKLNERFGQPVVVENRVGGGGNIAAEFVAKSEPDGYTLIIAGVPHAINMSLYKKLSYDMARDLAPITNLAVFPSMITVHPSLPVKTVKELIVLAKARPGQLNFGSSPGSPNHLAIELLNTQAGVKIVFIAYKGAGQALADTVAGHVQVASLGFPGGLPMVQAGKLRALAVTSATRTALLPDVPTVSESGVPGYEIISWYGVFAPPNVPEAIITRLYTEIAAAYKAPDVTKRMTGLGAEVSTMLPAEFGRFVRDEIKKWAPVVQASGAKAE
ncbi:MAG: tripartite tricarboxylate transporter substrate binding protein [Burkholderiales bacterium]